MEAVIAEAPVISSFLRIVPQLDLRSDRAVVVLHWAACFGPEDRRIMGRIFVNVDFSDELLEARRNHLLDYLVTALDRVEVAAEGVELAFERMNQQLKAIVGDKHAEDGFWRVQNSSLVIIVDDQRVHVFGNHLAGEAFLCRGGTDKSLLRRPPADLSAELKLQNSRTKFGYYHVEPLTPDDKYLVVGANHVTQHAAKPFAAVLETRIDAFGMEEACKQIAGRFTDKVPRTFLCLRLGEFRSKGWGLQEIEPSADWGVIGPSGEEDDDSSDEEEDDDDDEGAGEYWTKPSRLTDLYPLINGERQQPPPHTTCIVQMPRGPCIRVFSLKNDDEPEMIGKYNRCMIVVKVGDIRKWEFEGPHDFIVEFDGQTIVLVTSSGHAISAEPCIGNRDTLAKQCRKLFESPLARSVKRIAIPEDELFDVSYKEAADLIRAVIEKEGKIHFGQEEEEEPLLEVHFVLRSKRVWMIYAAAMEFLAHWSCDDLMRFYKLSQDPPLRARKASRRPEEPCAMKESHEDPTTSRADDPVPERDQEKMISCSSKSKKKTKKRSSEKKTTKLSSEQPSGP